MSDFAHYLYHNRFQNSQVWREIFGVTSSTQMPVGNFIITTGDGDKTQSIWQSDPIQCQGRVGTLTFRAWASKNTFLKLCLVDAASFKIIDGSCTPINLSKEPGNTVRLSIPADTQEFRMWLVADSWNNKQLGAVAIDAIQYDADLARPCNFNVDAIFRAYQSTANDHNIDRQEDLSCANGNNCRWKTTGNPYPLEIAAGQVSTPKWRQVTGSDKVPDGEFLMTTAASGPIDFVSDPIGCQEGEGKLNFKAWSSNNVAISVCQIFEHAPAQCQKVNRRQDSSYSVALKPAERFKIQIKADGFEPDGGLIALDDIDYNAQLCSALEGKFDVLNDTSSVSSPLTGADASLYNTKIEHYNCRFNWQATGCRWQYENNWAFVDKVDMRKLRMLTQNDNAKTTENLALHEFKSINDKRAIMTSNRAYCLAEPATLIFKSWHNPYVNLTVCGKGSKSGKKCSVVNGKPDQNVTFYPTDYQGEFWIEIIGETNDESFILIDEITMTEGDFCSEIADDSDIASKASHIVLLSTDVPDETYIETQEMYECGFDTATTSCFWRPRQGTIEHINQVDDRKLRQLSGLEETTQGGAALSRFNANRNEEHLTILSSNRAYCLKSDGRLTFDAWSSTNAELKVCPIYEESVDETKCITVPSNRNKADILFRKESYPDEFRIAILSESEDSFGFTLIDNIAFTGDLCDAIKNGSDIFNRSTVINQWSGIGSDSIITTPIEYNCNFNNANGECKYKEMPKNRWLWVTNPDARKVNTLTNLATIPETGTGFLPFTSSLTAGDLTSNPAYCIAESQALTITFKRWISAGVKLEVCAIEREDHNKDSLPDLCKEPIGDPKQSTAVVTFTHLELDGRFKIQFRAEYTPPDSFVMLDDIVATGELCSEEPITDDVADQEACSDLSTDFTGGPLNSDWSVVEGDGFGSMKITNRPLGNAPNIKVQGTPSGGYYVGTVLNGNVAALQSTEFHLQKSRFLRFFQKRGTYGSRVYMCENELPKFLDGDIQPGSNQCKNVAGPDLSYAEYREGIYIGFEIPTDVNRVYIVLAHPKKGSGADTAAFILDDFQLLKTKENSDDNLCATQR